MKFSKYIFIRSLIAVLVCAFITSCIPQPSASYDIQQSIYLQDLEERKITLEKKSKKKYHIYKLPYPLKTDYASFLRLSVILDNSENLEYLKDKGYFVVITNVSDDEQDIYSYIQRYADGNSRFARNEPFTVGKRRASSRILAQKTQQNPEEEYEKLHDSDSTEKSERSFFFDYGTQNHDDPSPAPIETTLYKKIHFTHERKTLYFALWVQKEKKKPSHTSLCPKLEPESYLEELYKTLYSINNNHIWGSHNFEDYAVGDSIIHIGFGKIENNNESESIAGFVDSRTVFYNTKTPKNYRPEEIIAPTAYINYDPHENNCSKLYDTLGHELQHIFTNYQKIMQQSSSADALTHQVDTWVHETLSIAAQYLIEAKKPLQEIHASKIYKKWYAKSNDILKEASLTNNENFAANSYKLAYFFVSYLVQNYGREVITKALKNSHRNSYALVQAVKDTKKYSEILSRSQPQTIEDILVQFFTAIFTSDSEQDLDDTSHSYKLFTKTNNDKTQKIPYPENEKNSRIHVIDLSDKFRIVSVDISPNFHISRDNIIFDAKAKNSENPNYTLQNGKYGVVYLGGRLSQDSSQQQEQGVFKINEEGHPYFTMNLPRGSVANLVVVEYL